MGRRSTLPSKGKPQPWTRWIGVGVALVLLAIYLLTLCPTIYSGDAAEIAAAGATFGIPHPPGYPLYTLVANLWSRLIFAGDVAWRINLLSATAAAWAALLIYYLLVRLEVGGAAAAVASLGLGVGVTCWSQAIISEVYAFDLMLGALALFAAGRARSRRNLGSAALALFCVGLWVGHRNVNLLYAPAALAIAWPALRTGLRSGRGAAGLLGALIAPFVVWLYLPLASSLDPLLDTGDPETWSRFWDVASAKVYRQYLKGGLTSDNLSLILTGFPRELGITLVMAPLGAATWWKRERVVVLALGYMAVANILFAASYSVPDVSVFTLPAILALTALAGLGAASLLGWLSRSRGAVMMRLALLALFGCVVALGVNNFGENDLRGQTLARDFARDALSYPEKKSLVLSHVDTVSYSLWYGQAVEELRTDLLVASKGRAVDWHQEQARRLRPDLAIPSYAGPDAVSRWPALLVERNARRVPVYITANLGGYFLPPDALRLSARFEEVPAGLMTRLVPRGTRPSSTATSPVTVIERNQAFWGRVWPHVKRARSQRLGTEMAAVLLHYASMRVLFSRYCLLQGRPRAARLAADQVSELDPGPMIAIVNAAYRRRGAQYHMSNMPEVTALLKGMAMALEAGQLTLDQIRGRLASRPHAAPATEPPEVARLNQQGIRLAQQRQMKAALLRFEQVLERMPSHRGALFNRAKVLAALGRGQEAELAYEALLKLSPRSLPGLLGLAELKLARDPEAAKRLYERALTSPGPEPLKHLARRRLAELQAGSHRTR